MPLYWNSCFSYCLCTTKETSFEQAYVAKKHHYVKERRNSLAGVHKSWFLLKMAKTLKASSINIGRAPSTSKYSVAGFIFAHQIPVWENDRQALLLVVRGMKAEISVHVTGYLGIVIDHISYFKPLDGFFNW